MKAYAITTSDNPYDPFDDFDLWFLFDETRGYHSCSYLDRVSYTSDSFTDEENMEEIKRAILEIMKYDVLGIYKMVIKELPDPKAPEDSIAV